MKTSTKWIIGILIVAFIVLPSIWGIIYYVALKKEAKKLSGTNMGTGTGNKAPGIGVPPPNVKPPQY